MFANCLFVSLLFADFELFLNITHSLRIPVPQLADGKPATLSEPLANIIFPLSLGKPRVDPADSARKNQLLDVVLHSSVLQRIASDLQWKLFIIELSMQHAEQDFGWTLFRGNCMQ